MRFASFGHLRQSIRARRVRGILLHSAGRENTGQLEWVSGLFGLLFVLVLVMFELQIYQYRTSSDYLEDALAASGLSAAVIDIRRYGTDRTLLIPDPASAYTEYLRALSVNLGLSEDGTCANLSLISSAVTVEDFRIYNVDGGTITIYRSGKNGFSVSTGILGEVTAPTGEVIRSTGIYSELSFTVRGFLGTEVPARKGKLVDIVAESVYP